MRGTAHRGTDIESISYCRVFVLVCLRFIATRIRDLNPLARLRRRFVRESLTLNKFSSLQHGDESTQDTFRAKSSHGVNAR